ncbi:MAG TPA: NAD(P)/FAD-dependent oxidoreductase [Vicinamibacterales bacterium]|nr:NAD(P)/FAD-dependent oxidoreductase [Vicinamibacterales bacterium]
MDPTPELQPCYDAIVIGARPAGAATAMLLARRGLRVLLADRDQRGRDTLSTHALMRGAVLQLARWGLLDAVRHAGTPAIRHVSFHYGDDEVVVPIKPRDGVDALYAPRRTVLDPILADAAREAGAHVVHGPRLVDLVRSRSGRIAGVVLEDRQGRIVMARAGIVIGADGLRSTVAQLVSAPTYRLGQHAAAVVYGYWADVDVEPGRYHWLYGPAVAAGAIATNDGAMCVFASMPAERFEQEIRRDMAAGYLRAIAETSPRLADALGRARPASGLRGYPGELGRFRQSWGPGWALVGDAGYFKDPITAHGITDALRDAELLAHAVTSGADHALAGYQAARDELSERLFEITDEIAGFHWTLDSIRTLHHDLNQAMKAEVDHLTVLDRGAAVA